MKPESNKKEGRVMLHSEQYQRIYAPHNRIISVRTPPEVYAEVP